MLGVFGAFRSITGLHPYYPSLKMKMAQENSFAMEELSEIDEDIADYLKSLKLTRRNISAVYEMLLQIEDLYNMAPYVQMYLKNVKVTQIGKTVSFEIDVPSDVNVQAILNPGNDEVVFVPLLSSLESNHKLRYPIDLLLEHPHESHENNENIRRQVFILDALRGNTAYVQTEGINTSQPYDIIFRPLRMQYRYQCKALELLNKQRIEYLFPNKNYYTQGNTDLDLNLLNKSIEGNPEQIQAIEQIVSGANPYSPYILFGPPGTGKTTTIVEAILQIYMRETSPHILVTASANSACDTLALKLCELFTTNKQLQNIAQSRRIFEANTQKLVNVDILRVFSRQNCTKNKNSLHPLLLEYSNYNNEMYLAPSVELLKKFHIIILTLNTMGRLRRGTKGNWPFTHIFIDEAGTSTLPEALIAITSVDTRHCRVILSGDTQQLRPVVKSPVAGGLGLNHSVMERLLTRHCYRKTANGTYDKTMLTLLRRNYRSHPEIMGLYNRLYYKGDLIAQVNMDKLLNVENVPLMKDKNFPILVQCVHGKLGTIENSKSYYNLAEVCAIVKIIEKLESDRDIKVTSKDIGVISPYNLQCTMLKNKLLERGIFGVEVGTVELFQGREKPVIIASFVKSNSTLGFTAARKRFNVIISRAQSLLILVGNPDTMSQFSDFKYILKECKRLGTVIKSCDLSVEWCN
uniref:Putative helicase MOV-10 n=1 Tax=Ceratitis capitata TaxID=7213 RepID=W8BT05_CERCA